jgi:transposase
MARAGRKTVELILSAQERSTLQRWVRRHTSSQALALRSRIVLACAEGRSNTDVGGELGVHPTTVSKWRHRFAADRLDGLVDAPRPGVPRSVGDDVVEAVVVDTLESAPADATHWSTRSLAAKHGISHTTVREIWSAFGLKPWQADTFKVSPDPDLVEKIGDLVGLYMNPPVAAAVFAVDEKPQIQALNRTAPTLPTTPQRATHDYRRNATVDLFAALEVATGHVITDVRSKHTSADFVAFWNKINRHGPQRARRPCDLGQPCHPQDPDRAEMVAGTPPVPLPLHADLRIVDEPGRTLVLGAHHQEAATLRPPIRQRTRRRHHRMGRHVEPEPDPVRLAQDRRSDPRTPRQLLHRHQPSSRHVTHHISQRISLPALADRRLRRELTRIWPGRSTHGSARAASVVRRHRRSARSWSMRARIAWWRPPSATAPGRPQRH